MNEIILIAEDEESTRELYRFALEQEGYKVLEAKTGREALEVIKENPVDLLLLDIKMPDMHGLKVLDELKKLKKDIPVIISTAYSGMKDDFSVVTSRVSDYLVKPVDLNELKFKVSKVLRKGN